jgi:hypothetical protein
MFLNTCEISVECPFKTATPEMVGMIAFRENVEASDLFTGHALLVDAGWTSH